MRRFMLTLAWLATATAAAPAFCAPAGTINIQASCTPLRRDAVVVMPLSNVPVGSRVTVTSTGPGVAALPILAGMPGSVAAYAQIRIQYQLSQPNAGCAASITAPAPASSSSSSSSSSISASALRAAAPKARCRGTPVNRC